MEGAAATRRLAHLGALLPALLLLLVLVARVTPAVGASLVTDPDAQGWTTWLALRAREGALGTVPALGVALAAPFASGGAVRFLDEAWAVAGLRLMLMLPAYLLARQVVGATAALVVALVTGAGTLQWTVGQLHLAAAALVAWSSLVLGIGAVQRGRGYLLAGSTAGLAFAFDQGLGFGSWLGGLVALVACGPPGGRRAALGRFALGALAAPAGIVAGAAWLGLPLLEALSAATVGLLQAEGGLGRSLAVRLLPASQHAATDASLLAVVVGAWFLWRWTSGTGGERQGLPVWAPLCLALPFAAGLCVHEAPAGALPHWVGFAGRRLARLALLGLPLVAFAVLGGRLPLSDERRRTLCYLMTAGVVMTLFGMQGGARGTEGLAQTPAVLLSMTALALAAEQARLRAAFLALAVLGGGAVIAPARAQGPRVTEGYYAGARINVRGEELQAAAAKVRELAGSSGEVLVLPEDPALALVLGGRRPALASAQLWPGQSPPRRMAQDLSRLASAPPEVVVVHPASLRAFQDIVPAGHARLTASRRIFEIVERLPTTHRRVATYRTLQPTTAGTLEVWVRR